VKKYKENKTKHEQNTKSKHYFIAKKKNHVPSCFYHKNNAPQTFGVSPKLFIFLSGLL